MQTPGTILVLLLSQLQITKGSRDTERHARTPKDLSHQTSFPYHKVTVLIGQGRTGNGLETVCLDLISQDQQMEMYEPGDSTFKGRQNLLNGQHCFLLFYFWLHWAFTAAHGLSLVAASGGCSSLWCTGFSLRWLLLLRSSALGARASVVVARGLSSEGSVVVALLGLSIVARGL